MPNQKEKHDLPELISCSVVCCSTNVDPICNLIKNTSSLIYLQKTIAYLQRFIYNFRNKSNKRTGHFSVTELKTSLYLLLHKAQLEMFPEEYAILKAKKSLPNKNRLISLIECIRRHFWDRFSLEYVALLQQKVKWHSTKTELKLGSLVLIKDRALPPSILEPRASDQSFGFFGGVVFYSLSSDGISRVAERPTKGHCHPPPPPPWRPF
ncbi:hypothetical protein SFRURICE_006626 [Spodoptera frugiperda]|nr:hypothetical protein SFRURICE_006626 [Spodoptera frugiperda]